MNVFFFFNDTATTEIYTLSLHDALPILLLTAMVSEVLLVILVLAAGVLLLRPMRSEEHTSELQSRLHLVCRLLLEKKKTTMSLINLYSHSAYATGSPYPHTRSYTSRTTP